jgi:ElaB/YqjD/DUF883 family membrane-anchored ribosome-binding protein
MSNDPDRIRWEIENTRNELSSDVDALTDKVNPRRIAGERVGQARGALTRAREKVMGVQSDGHGAGQRMSHAAGSARAFGEQSREQMSHAALAVRDEARSLGQQSRQQAQGNPLAAGLIAFGAGMLISSLIPPSRPERQWAGQARGKVAEHSGQLREQAGQVGHQMRDNLRDNLREPAQQAAQSVRSTATGSASAVREQGRSAVHQVQGQAHEAADYIRRR